MLNYNFKEIPNFEMYKISKKGKISNVRNIMKTYINNSGYECIKFTVNGKRTSHLIHRLVALVYLPNPNDEPTVNHKDGNKLNNNVENLEWCSYSKNILHARTTGLNPYNLPSKGIKLGKNSKYFNVTYDKARDKWKSCIRHEGKNYGQKRFNTEEEAALFVNETIKKYGLDRPLNII